MMYDVAERQDGQRLYQELEGARVLITGITTGLGVDVARAFAEQGCRLALHLQQGGPEMTAVLALLTPEAREVRAFDGYLGDHDSAVRFAQGAAQAFDGFDIVINIITPRVSDLSPVATGGQVDAFIAATLQGAESITHVAANRMGLTWTEGSILNVCAIPTDAGGVSTARAGALCGLLRSALAAMTQGVAREWADRAVRINAVSSHDDAASAFQHGTESFGEGPLELSSEADLVELALFLSSRRGRTLSGHMFDATGLAARVC